MEVDIGSVVGSGEIEVVDEGCGDIEVVEESVDDDEPLGARMKSAANAIQPVYAKLTIVLMSVRSYLHTTCRSARLSMTDSVDR